MSGREDLAGTGRHPDPAVERFLSAIPASAAWSVAAGAAPVTADRLVPAGHAGCCSLTPSLRELNAAVRAAAGEWRTVVAVACAGGGRAVELRACPVPGGAGELVMTARDVTAEEALREQLQRSAVEVRELRVAAAITDIEAVHLALSDALTALPNRRAFDLELAEACRRGRFALAIFDMDRFKAVNDELGHAVGDRLLAAVAAELRRHVRGVDFVARLGGDEFAVIFHDVDGVVDARDGAERLLRSCAARFDLGDVDLAVGLSAGVALHRPGDEPASVYREADMALHTAKVRRRGSIVVNAAAAATPSTRDELRTVKALLSGGASPVTATPIFDRNRRIVGREIAIGSGPAAAFDPVFATAVRFGLGRELLAVLLGRAAEAAQVWGRGGKVHVRLPADAVAVEGVARLAAAALVRAAALPTELAVEIPLAAVVSGAGEEIAAELADLGITTLLGDWDMSFAAFRAATEGRFAMVAFDAAGMVPSLAGPVADVWRAAFRSLAASRVSACARNVPSENAAAVLTGLGVALTGGRLAEVAWLPAAAASGEGRSPAASLRA